MARAPNGNGAPKQNHGGITREVVVSVATAIVMSLLGLFGNWVTHGGLIGLLGGVTATELRQQVVDEIKKLDIKPCPPGPPGTFAGRISFIAVRFGQNGSSEGVRGEGEPICSTSPARAATSCSGHRFSDLRGNRNQG